MLGKGKKNKRKLWEEERGRYTSNTPAARTDVRYTV